jgi:hypothetical protein
VKGTLQGPLRHLPRLLHHQHPGHHHRRQDPPRPRHHRTSPRRPEELSLGPPSVGQVHPERGLARSGSDGVQPHPRRRHPGRPGDGQGHHRHDPPQTRPRTSPDRILGPATDTAPAPCLALGRRVDHSLHRTLRTTDSGRDDLTTPPPQGPKTNQRNTTDSEVAGSVMPSHRINRSSQTYRRHQAHRWIEAKAVPAAVVHGGLRQDLRPPRAHREPDRPG